MSETETQQIVVSEEEKARRALEYVPPDCAREEWYRIAAALKDKFGDDGFELFDDWSREGKSYKPGSARDTWKSVKPGRISIATLYHEAKKYGFRPWEWQTESAPVRQDDGKRAAERARAEAEDARRQAEAGKKAVETFQKGRPVTEEAPHPYIVRKGLQAHPWLQAGAEAVVPREMDAAALAKHLDYTPKADGVPLAGRVLLIPVIDGRRMTTLELIDEQGRKTALAGGLKKGAWSAPVPMGQHLATNPDTPIVVVEGWATAYSVQLAFLLPGEQKLGYVNEMPDAYVVSAGADTNLGNVARALREQHPHAPIVVGADIGNPDSMKYARKAAASVGGCVMAPQFTDEQFRFLEGHLGKAPTDFNDQLAWYVTNRLPVDGFVKDFGVAFQHAEFPDRAEFPDLAPEAAASHAFRAHPGEAPSGDRTMEQEAQQPATGSKKQPGDPLYDVKNLPDATRADVQGIFGNRHTIYAPRENGGPYNGEVHDVAGYLIQEVGPRSVVVHDKAKLGFVGDRLEWLDKNQKLNGHDLAIYYNGDQAKAYPYDRLRDDLDRAVGSFKKSAKELGLDPQFAEQLDKAYAKSMERIQGMRKEAQARAKGSREARAAAPEAPAPKVEEQPAKPAGRKR